MHHHAEAKMQDCITACWSCRDICQETLFNVCMEKGHTEPDHVRLMMDCIQACQASADFMTRNSPVHAAMCRACAEVCDACANSCETMEDADMSRCADACRQCATSCREMAEGSPI